MPLVPDKPIESYEDYMQRMYALPESKIPLSVFRLFEQFKFRVLRMRGSQDLLNNDLKEVDFLFFLKFL